LAAPMTLLMVDWFSLSIVLPSSFVYGSVAPFR
jgi:hypothetical protein